MDPETTEYFAGITTQAKVILGDVHIYTDMTPDRALLLLTATYGNCRVVVNEVVAGNLRHYSYYILRGTYVEAGFDNSPDPSAIRLKFGRIGLEHEREQVPHLHTENKQQLELTKEIFFHQFLEWLIKNVPTT